MSRSDRGDRGRRAPRWRRGPSRACSATWVAGLPALAVGAERGDAAGDDGSAANSFTGVPRPRIDVPDLIADAARHGPSLEAERRDSNPGLRTPNLAVSAARPLPKNGLRNRTAPTILRMPRLVAVVMAAGQGTRMKSDDPEGAARPVRLAARALARGGRAGGRGRRGRRRRRAGPGARRAPARGRRARRAGGAARDRRRGAARRPRTSATRTRSSCSPATCRSSPPTRSRSLADAHDERGAAGDDGDDGPRRPRRATAASCATTTGDVVQGRRDEGRRATRRRRSSRSGGQHRRLRVRRRAARRRARARSRPTTPRASTTCPTCCRSCASTATRSPRTSSTTRRSRSASTTASTSRASASSPSAASTSATCANGVTIVQPRVDRRSTSTVDDRPRHGDRAVHRPARRRARRRRRIGPSTTLVDTRSATAHGCTPTSSTRRSRTASTIGPYVHLRGGTVLRARREGRHVRRDEELRHRRGHEGPAPLLPRRRDVGRGHEHRRGATSPPTTTARDKHPTTIGADVKTGVDTTFVAPVTVGDDAVIAAGSVITEDVPPDALGVARARQTNIEGYARRKG